MNQAGFLMECQKTLVLFPLLTSIFLLQATGKLSSKAPFFFLKNSSPVAMDRHWSIELVLRSSEGPIAAGKWSGESVTFVNPQMFS